MMTNDDNNKRKHILCFIHCHNSRIMHLHKTHLVWLKMYGFQLRESKSHGQKISEIVFCYQNCSEPLWEKNILVIEKNFWNLRLKFWSSRICKNFEIPRTLRTIFKTECFLTCSWRFRRSDTVDTVDSGNALARVQRVHEPADLWDITFCTRWFWGF